jgi:hypothetical protein
MANVIGMITRSVIVMIMVTKTNEVSFIMVVSFTTVTAHTTSCTGPTTINK